MVLHGGKTKGYFLSSQSGQGYYSFLKESLQNIQKKIFVIGGTNQLRSRIMRNVGFPLVDRGYNMELIYDTINPINLEGIIIPQLDLAVLCGETWDSADMGSEVINLNTLCDNDQYLVYKSKIKDLREQAQVSLELAQEEIAALKKRFLLDGGKKDEMDEGQALYITEKLLKSLFSLDQGKLLHRFAQCLTSKGFIDYYDKFLTNTKNKNYLNGMNLANACGILKLVAREAVGKGLVVEVYHNCLEPALIELLIIPHLNLAIGIHNFTEDFQKLINYKGKKEENTSKTIYDLNLENAVKFLEQVDLLNDEADLLYNESIDFTGLHRLEEKLLAEILKSINSK